MENTNSKLVKQQEDLHVSVDSGNSHVKYGTVCILHISGGSGSGGVHGSLKSLTGVGILGTSSTSDTTYTISFSKPGTVLFCAYKEASETAECFYEQSKWLVVQLHLDQLQLTVQVANTVTEPNWVYNIGQPVPEEDTLQNHTVIGTFPSSRDASCFDNSAVNVYIVNNSEDYYQFDVFSKSSGVDSYDNGIRYTVEADGSFHVFGKFKETGYSTYRLITSVQKLPNYFHPGRRYILSMKGVVPIVFKWYDSTGSQVSSTYRGNRGSSAVIQEINVDSSYTGVEIMLQLYGLTGQSIDEKIQYHLFDTTNRGVDNTHPGEYAIAARGAKVPHDSSSSESPINFGYQDEFKYRSAKLIYQNTRNYKIYTQYASSRGNITVSSYAKPYDEVTFTITANTGFTFDDGYYTDPSSTSQEYTSGNTSAATAPTTLFVYDLWSGGVVEYEPISYSITTSGGSGGKKNYLISCSYRFIMPITDVMIECSFYSSSRTKYGYVFPFDSYYSSSGLWPYRDIGMSSDSYYNLNSTAVYLNRTNSITRNDYTDALLYCRYAREYFFQEYTAPILTGNLSGTFYDTIQVSVGGSSNYVKVHAVRRRELVDAIRRISHGVPDIGYSYSTVRTTPDNIFTQHAYVTNTPDARAFTYAGYNYPHDSVSGATVIQPTNVGPTSKVFGKVVLDDPLTLDIQTAAHHLPAIGYYVVSPSQEGTVRGANDDYLMNFRYMPSLSWSVWIGALRGYSEREAGANTFATYQEVANLLWRYAKFRQFDIHTPGSYPSITSEEETDLWARTGAIRWLETHGISTGYHCPYKDECYFSNGEGSSVTYGRTYFGTESSSSDSKPLRMRPTDVVDRVEFAYMLMKFCQLYAW